MKHLVILICSISANVALLSILVMNLTSSTQTTKLSDRSDRIVSFSLAVVADMFTSVGESNILSQRKSRAARLYILNSLMDEKYCKVLEPVEVQFLRQTINEGCSHEEIKIFFSDQFAGVEEIRMEADCDGLKRLYFEGGNVSAENPVRMVILGAKSNFFRESLNDVDAREQINLFVQMLTDEIGEKVPEEGQ